MRSALLVLSAALAVIAGGIVNAAAVSNDALQNVLAPPAHNLTLRRPRKSDIDNVLCIGHRGWSAKYAENTVESVRRAYELGADGVEIDVQLTADGEVILMTDETLDRTTNGTGKVAKRNWFGYIDSLVTTEGGLPVPRLQEALKLLTLDDTKDIFLIVDIKPLNGVKVVSKVAEIIKSFKYEFRTQVQIGVWTAAYYDLVKKLMPKVLVTHIGYDLRTARSTFDGANAYSMYYPSVVEDRSGFLRHIHKKDKALYAWLINDEEEMENAMDNIGVDGVITDFVDICLDVRREGLVPGGKDGEDEGDEEEI
ncbi:hypothetical protein HDU96_005476 [Phlyctochytrium bullatum]|nr:hypothetical protein HDU96_005476 [Phlyctochytrium bullatum]